MMPLDIEWVTIPLGSFFMGTSENDAIELACRYQSNVFLLEKPRKEVAVSSFQISKYPITNAQFLAFVKETGRLWSPHVWGREEFLKPNHPARFLSFDDALAFCWWAKCRLPTEVEWEKAASGPEGFEFPWGNEWDPAVCNSRELYRDQIAYKSDIETTPVDQFPQGASPYGVMDMAGNVWELTSSTMLVNLETSVCTTFEHPNQPKEKYDWEYTTFKEYPVLRGGACNCNRLGVRCSFRFTKYHPRTPGDFQGFRVVMVK